jgi:hypothetical protein
VPDYDYSTVENDYFTADRNYHAVAQMAFVVVYYVTIGRIYERTQETPIYIGLEQHVEQVDKKLKL